MFIAFVPFSTTLIGEYGDQQISVIIYGINIVIVGFLEYVQWWYAAKDHHLVDSDLDPHLYSNNVKEVSFSAYCLFDRCWYIFYKYSGKPCTVYSYSFILSNTGSKGQVLVLVYQK
jgi:uncharacterized membrane protein